MIVLRTDLSGFYRGRFLLYKNFKTKFNLAPKGSSQSFVQTWNIIDPIGSALAFGPNYNILTDRLRNHFWGLGQLRSNISVESINIYGFTITILSLHMVYSSPIVVMVERR